VSQLGTLIYFGFTYCPDVCPTTLATFKQVWKLLDADARARLRFDFISVDLVEPLEEGPACMLFTREFYTLVTYLQSDGELQQFNTKDPAYAQKMMGLSQNVQKSVRAALWRRRAGP